MGKIEQIREVLLEPFKSFESLADTERQVLTLASQGFTNREIANLLGTTDELVAYYMRNGLMKINKKKKELPIMVISTIKSIVG